MDNGKTKEDGASSKRRSLSIVSLEKGRREDLESGPKIFFAPDPREKIRLEEITTLPLSRTFSRNSYSTAGDEEAARVKRATVGKTVDPHARLPTGKFPNQLRVTELKFIEH